MEDYTFNEDVTSGGGKSTVLVIILILITLVLGGALWYIWQLNEENELQLEERKAELAASMQDLLQLQEAYSGLSQDYDSITLQLDSSRVEVELLMSKLKHERQVSNETIKQYQKELGTLRTIMRGYIMQIDSLQKENTKLAVAAAAARQEAAASKKMTEELSKTVSELSGQITANSVLKAYGLKTEAFNKSDKPTDRSTRVDYLLTTLTLGENDLAAKGAVTVYVCVTDPNGVLLDNGNTKTFEYKGEKMQSSASREVDYQGAAVDLGIYLNDIEEYVKGVYTVKVYARNTFLGSTEILFR